MFSEDHNTLPADADVRRFKLAGDVWPLQGLAKAAGATIKPSRPMGGWLCTYGKVGPDGGIVPTVDREGQVIEAARQIGFIDWQKYIKGGVWNDTHDHDTIVGLPTTLEFHDGTTKLSKAHGKVGFWTTGHLFDRQDPSSWAGLTDAGGSPRTPSEHELQRADYFWQLSHLLKGTPRPLGLSADGIMALSRCRRRVLWARVDAAAVCEVPVNPDATVEPMIFAVLGKALVGRTVTEAPPECGRCTCGPNACERLMRKASSSTPFGANSDTEHPNVIPQYGDGGNVERSLGSPHSPFRANEEELFAHVIELLQRHYFVSEKQARQWLTDFLRRRARTTPSSNPKERSDDDSNAA